MWNNEPERYTNRIEVIGLYWHFVDLVWIISISSTLFTIRRTMSQDFKNIT